MQYFVLSTCSIPTRLELKTEAEASLVENKSARTRTIGPPPPAHPRRRDHRLVGAGLTGVGVALHVGVIVQVSLVAIEIILVVVVVCVGDKKIHNIEQGEEKCNDAKCADSAADNTR